MFLEGQDDALLHYDGGEFHQWLVDCRTGAVCHAACALLQGRLDSCSLGYGWLFKLQGALRVGATGT